MNPDYEKQLEARVRRELDSLGELPAPASLANRILTAIDQRSATPWYRRPWPTWPTQLRLASLSMMLLAFVGMCVGVFKLGQAMATLETRSSWLADLQALWRTAEVLGGIVHNLTTQLGTGIILTALVLLFFAAATCLALGSACMRLALRPARTGI